MKAGLVQVGDLVYHLIHGKEWVAVVLNMDLVLANCLERDQLCREYVLVHMQHGSKYQDYFKLSPPAIRRTNYSGLVSYHWLRSADI